LSMFKPVVEKFSMAKSLISCSFSIV
jgi:hypothetical protein